MVDHIKISTDPQLDLFVRTALGRKAMGLVVLDMRSLTSVADAFIICSGRSHRQVTAIAEHIISELKKHQIQPLNREGVKEGHWVLLDYGDVVIHIFYEPLRRLYDLEGLWVDAQRVKTPSIINEEKRHGEPTNSDPL